MQQYFKAGLQLLWPKRFVAQVTLLTAILVTLGISTLTLYSTTAFLNQQHTDAEDQLVAMADNLAFGSTHLLLVRDSAALEQLLLKAATYPKLRSIALSDASNHVLGEVQRKAGQPAEALFNYCIALPPHGNSTQFVWHYGNQTHSARFAFGLDASQLEIWHPIEGGTLGWLHIIASVDDIRSEALLRIKENMLFALIVVVLTTLGLVWLLRPNLRAISAATDFARGLTQAHGQQIPTFSSSIELHQLCTALNEASGQLYSQKTAIQDSSERLQAVFGNVMEGIITWDAEGNIESANTAAHQIFGYDNMGLVGKSMHAIVPLWNNITTEPSSTGGEQRPLSSRQEVLGTRLDGTQICLDIAISTFTLHNARYYIGAIHDISLRKEAEKELRESEQRFRFMLETCPTAARIARSGGHDVIFYNSRYAELIHANPTQVAGINPAKYYADPAEYADIVSRIQKGEQIFDRLIELNIPGDGTKWVLASYLSLQYQEESVVLGWFHDITRSKLSEAALRDQSEHTQAILDNMVDGIITIDQTGLIASFSPAAERIFGYTPEEVLGRNVKMLMPNPHRDAHDSYLRNYQTTGIARIIGIGREVEGQRKDGSLFPMELAIAEITRQGRSMYIGTVRDITERKQIERMKTEFVSTVSHELRTPLTSISGALGLIAGGALGEIPAQAKQMIGIAYKNSQRLTFLINDLLDMEKLVAGKMHFDMQPQLLMPLIEQTLEANRTYGTERRVSLALVGAVPDAEVQVDSQRLMQVMSNLLSNAIKYSPEGGTVEIAVEALGKMLRVSITDHGSGIPAAFHARIFQKFSQADSSDTRQKGGTGLGLAITRELVERMGGSIGFESEEGQGARFYFEFPVALRGIHTVVEG